MEQTKRDKAYSLVKNIFKAEAEIRLAVVEAKTAERKGFSGGGGQAYKSDPTADKAARFLDDVPMVRIGDWVIRRPEDWLKVISLTYKHTKKLEREVLQRYNAGAKLSEIAKDVDGYEQSSLYVFKNNFFQRAVEIACQMGLLKVV